MNSGGMSRGSFNRRELCASAAPSCCDTKGDPRFPGVPGAIAHLPDTQPNQYWRTNEAPPGSLVQMIGNALGDLHHPFRVSVDQQYGKFVAAVARGHIGDTAILFHHTGKTPQGAVTSQMPQPVINTLQIVQIKKE